MSSTTFSLFELDTEKVDNWRAAVAPVVTRGSPLELQRLLMFFPNVNDDDDANALLASPFQILRPVIILLVAIASKHRNSSGVPIVAASGVA